MTRAWRVRAEGGVVAIALVIAVLGISLLVNQCGGCEPRPIPIDLGIDAGPGEQMIAARLDAALQRVDERLAEIDRQYAEDIAAFDAQQREKYEALANEDLDTVVRFLDNWHRDRTRP